MLNANTPHQHRTMLKAVRSTRSLSVSRGDAINPHARTVALAIPILFLSAMLIMPMNAACQRQHPSPEAGIEELRALVTGASGAPSQADLLKFEGRFSRTRAAGLARFLRGYLAYSSRSYQAATEALDAKAIGSTTSLADYALFFRADGEANAGNNSDALRDYRELGRTSADSIKAREAVLRAAQAALALGDSAEALKEVGQLLSQNDPDALYLSGQAQEASGNRSEAIRVYRQIYYELPATSASAQAETRLAGLNLSPRTSPAGYEEELARCERLFEAKQYAEAAGSYDNLAKLFPDRQRSDEILLHYGASLLNNRQPAQAVTPLGNVSDRTPAVHAEALFHLAEALRKSNRAAAAVTTVDRLIGKYPKSHWAEEAIHDAAGYLSKEGRDAEAAVRYRQLIAMFPKGSYASEASYNLGWQAYQQKRYSDAAKMLEQHLATYRYPETRFIGEAAFWAAKSEERLGNRARALALYDLVTRRYKFGYHGYVAGLRASRLRSADPSLKGAAAEPGSDLERIAANMAYVEPVTETADGSETKRFEKAADLEVIGLYDLAVRELNAAVDSAPTSPKINLRLAQLYQRRGDNFQATLILRRGYPDIYSYKDEDLPKEAWEIFFPLSNWETIKQEARRYGIDPYAAAGLIRQESVFNPNAVSRVGARGLMQVMLPTGQLIAKRQGNGSITAGDLFNPTLNIKLGMGYWSQMLGQFGRLEYAAAAYNAGPGRAERWIAERGSLDIEDWIESIPFSETRVYVQGVLRYTANYRRFYKD